MWHKPAEDDVTLSNDAAPEQIGISNLLLLFEPPIQALDSRSDFLYALTVFHSVWDLPGNSMCVTCMCSVVPTKAQIFTQLRVLASDPRRPLVELGTGVVGNVFGWFWSRPGYSSDDNIGSLDLKDPLNIVAYVNGHVSVGRPWNEFCPFWFCRVHRIMVQAGAIAGSTVRACRAADEHPRNG